MTILTPSPQQSHKSPPVLWRPGRGLTRWRPRKRHFLPLAAAGGVATLIMGGGTILGLGTLLIGGMVLTRYWAKANRSDIWIHILVDTDDVIISLALPIPLSLLRWGLRRASITAEAANVLHMILEDPELLETLHHDAIEIQVDDGSDHIEVVIGARRKHWRAFQFTPVRSFAKNPLTIQEEKSS